jgi:hypothetical protein
MGLRPDRLRPARDVWVRQETVARLLSDGEPVDGVLDVGGFPGLLDPHLPGTTVVVANVEVPADVVYEGETLPFEADSFDAVTSIGVIEHMESAQRARHVAELLRVARRRVVVCCPAGSDGHVEAEAEFAEWYAGVSGARERWLDEHAEYGLPSPDELRRLATGAPAADTRVLFQGDYRTTIDLYRLEAAAHFHGRAGDRARFLWHRLRTPVDSALREAPTRWDNSALLVLTPERA